jgi:hypothetical protein
LKFIASLNYIANAYSCLNFSEEGAFASDTNLDEAGDDEDRLGGDDVNAAHEADDADSCDQVANLPSLHLQLNIWRCTWKARVFFAATYFSFKTEQGPML